jgi:glycosyltransferase involved in cell wall biosynthesis
MMGGPAPGSLPPDRLRVNLDATSLLDAITGVGVFTTELLAGLVTRDDVHLTAFCITWRGRARLRSVVDELADGPVTVRARPFPARVARALWRRVDAPAASLLAGPGDVVHGPNFVVPPGGGQAEVVTVHDLTALHHPEMCTPDVLEWPGLLRRALRRGAWVHTVSEFVADEVREAFPEAGDRVVAVHNGVRPAPAPGPGTGAANGHRLAGGDRYVLAVGTVEPRKDLPGLVAAWDAHAADDPDVRLVIAGGDGMGADALDAAIARAHHRDRVVRLGRVAPDDRLGLLRGASVVAYPSVYEGFGLVPLEAMGVGVPVVATSAGAIPEVVGEAAALVPPGDPDALAGALARVLDDTDLRARLVAAGAERVARYRWDDAVEGIVSLYRRAAAAR